MRFMRALASGYARGPVNVQQASLARLFLAGHYRCALLQRFRRNVIVWSWSRISCGLTIRSSGPLRRAAVLSCGGRQRPLNSSVRHLFGMETTASSRLQISSSWLLVASLLACIIGVAWTIAEAPCSKVGAVLLLAAVGLGVLSAVALLVRAFLVHPIRSIAALLVVVVVCGVEYFVSFTFTPLLCRGI